MIAEAEEVAAVLWWLQAAYAAWGILAYLCDDDFYYPNHLTVCSAALRRHPTWDVVYGRQQLVERIALGGLQNTERRRTSDQPNAKGELRDAFCKVDHAQVMHRIS